MNLDIKDEKIRICFSHIDSQIENFIKSGKDAFWIIQELNQKVSKFDVILNDIKENEPRYNFLQKHNLVCKKRINDFVLIENKFHKQLSLDKKFKLIKFRDKFIINFLRNL